MTGLTSILIAQAPAEPGISISLDDPKFLGALLLIGLPYLISTANGITQFIKHFKADPPAHKVYATKEETEDLEERLTKRIDDEAKKVCDVEVRLNQRIDTDGAELKAVEQRLTLSQSASESRIQTHLHNQDKFQGGLQAELKNIHSQLGKIHGQLEAQRASNAA